VEAYLGISRVLALGVERGVVVAHQRVDPLLESLQLWRLPCVAQGAEVLVNVPSANDRVGLLELASHRIPKREKDTHREKESISDHALYARVVCRVCRVLVILFVGGIIQFSLLQETPVV
jgi:hypothetical protein